MNFEATEQAVLSCWKDIANYLGKGVRTVQRWERDYDLPVLRPNGNRYKNAVIAYRHDLDAWLASKWSVRGLHGISQERGTRLGCQLIDAPLHPQFSEEPVSPEVLKEDLLVAVRRLITLFEYDPQCENEDCKSVTAEFAMTLHALMDKYEQTRDSLRWNDADINRKSA